MHNNNFKKSLAHITAYVKNPHDITYRSGIFLGCSRSSITSRGLITIRIGILAGATATFIDDRLLENKTQRHAYMERPCGLQQIKRTLAGGDWAGAGVALDNPSGDDWPLKID